MVFALLFFITCITVVVLVIVLDDAAKDLVRALTDRVRNPPPSMLEELHRHWEESDRIAWGMGNDRQTTNPISDDHPGGSPPLADRD